MTEHRPVAVFIICAGIAYGQSGAVSGLIQDPSSSPISGAEVSIRNAQTGGRRNTVSNSAGFYSLPSLSAGEYRLSIRAAGFETIVREHIGLQVGENARLDFNLRLGDVRTAVTVTSGALLMNVEDASVGTVIDRKIIDQMPLNGRGLQSLIELSPGVVAVPVIDANSGQFVVNGQRSNANYFTVDGVSADFAVGEGFSPLLPQSLNRAGNGMIPANNFLGTFSNLVSPDALQEFKIQTSTFAPEYGRSPGAQIAFITRSGTNHYSGSLSEYFRNDKIDANDWFRNREALGKVPLRFNNFGGTVSGPVRIPHLYNGQDRTFFFLAVEGLAVVQPQPPVSILVPTLQARRDAPPLVAALLSAYPLPNRLAPDSAPSGFAEYIQSESLSQDQETYSLRLDHAFDDKLMSFVRYNRAPSSRLAPYVSAPTIGKYTIRTEALTFGLTQTLTPSVVNEIRLNGSRQFAEREDGVDSAGGGRTPPESLILPTGYSLRNSLVSLGVFPSPVFDLGFTSLSRSRQLQGIDNSSYAFGSHQLKIGADYRWFSPVTSDPRLSYSYNFPDLYGPFGAYTGVIPRSSIIVENVPTNSYVLGAFSAYVQDTWKVRRRFTINYGLRWEVNPAPHSLQQAAVLNGLTNPADASITSYVPPGKPFYATSWLNVAPRMGVGWQLHDGARTKSVLRVGGGRFFDLGQAGFVGRSFHDPTIFIYTNQPLGSMGGGTLVGQSNLLITQSTAVAPAHGYALPYTWQGNVTLEQSIGQQTFSAGYVGALGRRLVAWADPYNQSAVVPVILLSNKGSSSYHSLQLEFNRRLSSALHILLSYTWSHSIDNVSSDWPFSANAVHFLDALKRGPSDFDIRQSLNGSVIAALPAPHSGMRAVFLRNWTVNSIFFARSALPTDLLAVANQLGRPDLVQGQTLYLYGSGFPGGKSYNRAAFSIPSDGIDGNLGRNVLRGLGAWEIDLALHREFQLTEGVKLQFRAEAFNMLNHPNFANPSDLGSPGILTLSSGPGFGSATQTLATGLSPANVVGQLSPVFQIGGPRSIQFAVKLRF